MIRKRMEYYLFYTANHIHLIHFLGMWICSVAIKSKQFVFFKEKLFYLGRVNFLLWDSVSTLNLTSFYKSRWMPNGKKKIKWMLFSICRCIFIERHGVFNCIYPVEGRAKPSRNRKFLTPLVSVSFSASIYLLLSYMIEMIYYSISIFYYFALNIFHSSDWL